MFSKFCIMKIKRLVDNVNENARREEIEALNRYLFAFLSMFYLILEYVRKKWLALMTHTMCGSCHKLMYLICTHTLSWGKNKAIPIIKMSNFSIFQSVGRFKQSIQKNCVVHTFVQKQSQTQQNPAKLRRKWYFGISLTTFL